MAEQNGHVPDAGPQENTPFAGKYEKFQVRPSAWLEARGLQQETLDRYDVFEYRNDKPISAYNDSVMLKIRRYSDGETGYPHVGADPSALQRRSGHEFSGSRGHGAVLLHRADACVTASRTASTIWSSCASVVTSGGAMQIQSIATRV